MPRPEDWSPNPLEEKCLRHLDSDENWVGILKQPRPPEGQHLPLRPFRRIFLFNLILFSGILGVLLSVIYIGVVGPSDLREDLPLVGATAALGASGSAAWTTHLYRRTWNRRARYLKSS